MFWEKFLQLNRNKPPKKSKLLLQSPRMDILKNLDIIKIINKLKNSESSRASQYINSWLEGDKTAEVENENLYQNYKKELIAAFGPPTYQGVGPRWGYKGIEPKKITMEYGSAIDLAWWEKDSFTIFIMLTGHDADTLRQLFTAVAKSKGLAEQEYFNLS